MFEQLLQSIFPSGGKIKVTFEKVEVAFEAAAKCDAAKDCCAGESLGPITLDTRYELGPASPEMFATLASRPQPIADSPIRKPATRRKPASKPRKSAAARTDASGKSARDRVFDAAISFGAEGSGATQIASRAGVSSPTVYAKISEGLKDGSLKLLRRGVYVATQAGAAQGQQV